MTLIINGQEIAFSLETENTLGDVLFAVEEDCSKNKAAMTRITVDGIVLNDDNFDEYLTKELDVIDTIDLEVITEDDALKILLDTCNNTQKIIEQLLQIPVLLQSSKDKEASNIVMGFVDTISHIYNVVYFSSLFPQRFENLTIQEQSVADFLKDFTPVLQEFEASLESQDTVLTGDLAEYEIVPRLEAFVTDTKPFCEKS